MKILIEIDTGNAAFEDYGPAFEAARILGEAAETVGRRGCLPAPDSAWPLLDANGNVVGRISTRED